MILFVEEEEEEEEEEGKSEFKLLIRNYVDEITTNLLK